MYKKSIGNFQFLQKNWLDKVKHVPNHHHQSIVPIILGRLYEFCFFIPIYLESNPHYIWVVTFDKVKCAPNLFKKLDPYYIVGNCFFFFFCFCFYLLLTYFSSKQGDSLIFIHLWAYIPVVSREPSKVNFI